VAEGCLKWDERQGRLFVCKSKGINLGLNSNHDL
jgi:hypothetical protein